MHGVVAPWAGAAGFQVADAHPPWWARCGGVGACLPVAGSDDKSELFRLLVTSAVRDGAKTTVVGVTRGGAARNGAVTGVHRDDGRRDDVRHDGRPPRQRQAP